MDTVKLLQERTNRIKAAINLEKPDRVPVVPLADVFAARVMGIPLTNFIYGEGTNRAMIDCWSKIGEIDGHQRLNFNVFSLSAMWLSKLKLPGIHLPEDVLYQVAEAEIMKKEDYDEIISQGFNTFVGDYYKNRLDDVLPKLKNTVATMPQAIKEWEDAGVLPMCPGSAIIPFEYFCGGRSLKEFVMDMRRIPDKVQEAMDVAMIDIVENTRQSFRRLKPFGAWVGGWRSAPELLSPKISNRFVYPYLKKLVEVCIEEDVVPVFHFDSNWGRDLQLMRELYPKAKCVLALDGATDIFKAKEILGDHMCIMGDVPPGLLSIAEPKDVSEYCKRLVREIGPTGFILAQGCDIPVNAKIENVRAMVEAVHLA